MPNQDFVGLVNTLQATAEAALGELNASSALARRDGLTETPARARETATRSLRRTTRQTGPVRDSLIKRGLLFSPRHGELALTVPMFDDFMRRTLP